MAGLAIAESIVSGVQVLILGVIMIYRDRKLLNAQFWVGIIKILSVTGFTVLGGFIMISLMPLGLLDRGFITLGSKLFIISVVTLLVHVVVSALFDLDESKPIIKFVRRIALKPIKIDFS